MCALVTGVQTCALPICRRSTYWLQQGCLSGLYFNCEDIIKNNEGNWMNQSSVTKYYINPPYEARLVNEYRRRGGEEDRKSVVEGKRVAVGGDLGGRRTIQTNKEESREDAKQKKK